VNPFLRRASIFVASHCTHYVASGVQQEGYLEQSENYLETLGLPLDGLDLNHTDG